MFRCAFVVLLLTCDSRLAAGAKEPMPMPPLDAVVQEVGAQQLMALWWPDNGGCAVMLAFDDKAAHAEADPSVKAARLSLRLQPAQSIVLDTPDGAAAEFACAADGSQLTLRN